MYLRLYVYIKIYQFDMRQIQRDPKKLKKKIKDAIQTLKSKNNKFTFFTHIRCMS